MPQLFSALRVLSRHTVMKSALVARVRDRSRLSRRFVVDEISAEEAATIDLPRAYDVRRFIDVDDADDEREPARQETDGDEHGEEREVAPA